MAAITCTISVERDSQKRRAMNSKESGVRETVLESLLPLPRIGYTRGNKFQYTEPLQDHRESLLQSSRIGCHSTAKALHLA